MVAGDEAAAAKATITKPAAMATSRWEGRWGSEGKSGRGGRIPASYKASEVSAEAAKTSKTT